MRDLLHRERDDVLDRERDRDPHGDDGGDGPDDHRDGGEGRVKHPRALARFPSRRGVQEGPQTFGRQRRPPTRSDTHAAESEAHRAAREPRITTIRTRSLITAAPGSASFTAAASLPG